MNERIKFGGFDGRVSFVCRYRNVNTYKLESSSVYPGDRVDITDEGKLYHPDQIFSWDRHDVLGAIAEYETRCWDAFVKWCESTGNEIGDHRPHQIAYPFVSTH